MYQMTYTESALYLSDRNAGRVVSLDVLRGITIFLMLFVNDLAGVADVPAWLKHMPSSVDGMTFVDLVFPAFLFVMGMSIPIAIGRRLDSDRPLPAVLFHALIRTGSLLLIGVLMVNSPDDARMGMPGGLWSLLMYLGVFLLWHIVPAKSLRYRILSLVLRLAGGVLLAWLAIRFRDAEGNWMSTQWWGILGLIGWAYLIATAVYLAVRDNRAALGGAVALLLCVFVAFREGLLSSPWVGGGTVGSHPAIAVAGVLLGTLIYPGTISHYGRLKVAFALTAFAAAGAWLLRPLYGIGKNAATPSWCLWAIAITATIWAVLYWLVDMNGWERAWRPFRYTGMNPLFAYLLAPLVYAIIDLTGIGYWGLGHAGFTIGLTRSITFAVIVSLLAAWAARHRFLLKL